MQPKLEFNSRAYTLGPFELSKDFYYIGQWLEGSQNGLGKLYFPDKSVYYG